MNICKMKRVSECCLKSHNSSLPLSILEFVAKLGHHDDDDDDGDDDDYRNLTNTMIVHTHKSAEYHVTYMCLSFLRNQIT